MPATKRLRKVREKLWNKDPRCYYCGVVTIPGRSDIKEVVATYSRGRRTVSVKIPIHQEIKYQLATIDHLYPRHHPERQKPNPKEQRYVLSCWKCNNERDTRELREKPREWFYENGQSLPLALRSDEELQEIFSKLTMIKPRRKNFESVKKSMVNVLWAIWERGIDGGTSDG